jgi:penicillin-binding protein 2
MNGAFSKVSNEGEPMKFYRLLTIATALVVLTGCGLGSGGVNPTNVPVLPTPIVYRTPPPEADPQSAMKDFLDAWQKDDYAAMYPLLSQESQAGISLDDFTKRYHDSMNSLTLKEMSYEISSNKSDPETAQVNFKVTFKTHIAGDLVREMTADLKLENYQWRINWNDGLILPELRDGATLSLDYQVPPRGIIYDRKNQPLVTQTDVMALAINPAQLNDGEATLVGELSRLTGMSIGNIMGLYDYKRGQDTWVPVGEAPLAEFNKRYDLLTSVGGLIWSQYSSRFYYNGGIAPQSVGYVSPVPKEQLDEYVRQGYSPNTRIGQAGIERWGENLLAGKTGGTLYVVGKDGKIISTLGKSETQPASSITLTIDKDFQAKAQKAMLGIRGSVVVLERNTGRVLAMVSSPAYDPNLFEPGNANGGYALGDLLNDPDQPMYARATQGQYPLGSVFKVITFSAALESGTYTPDTKYQCGYDFTELSDRGIGPTLHDWTYEHMQNEIAAGDEPPYTQPSGLLTLTGGLMRSCNPYFWHIGRDLFLQGRTSAIADMARGFGLGKETGIGALEEKPGTIVNPTTELEATNQAIGQGDVLVTPLQVADFMAAIGNGGTLYRPQIVEKTTDANGVETAVFKPESRGVLPLHPETLTALRTAMLAVVREKRGTAYSRFYNLRTPIYGKTGTAETNGTSHAWFAGYTDANNPDLPDIAIAVIAENGGEGSVVAAPIFKRIVEIYFTGQAQSSYPWEAYIGATKTPTPEGFDLTQTAEAPQEPKP